MNGWIRCDSSACVEVRPATCGGGECVEALPDGDRVLVRSTERPEQIVWFSREEWAAFLARVKAGEFDDE